MQPKDESGEPIEMTEATMRQIEIPMRLVGNVLCVRNAGESKLRTRVSLENVDKINIVYQECRHEHKQRVRNTSS